MKALIEHKKTLGEKLGHEKATLAKVKESVSS